MPEKPADPTVSHQVGLVVRRLEALSVLPSVAAKCFSEVLQFQSLPPELAETIESSPALSAKILSLMHKHLPGYGPESVSVTSALNRLPPHLIHDALFSVKIYPAFGPDDSRALLRKQLVLHCLAVACCAKDIAEIISPPIDADLAYSAGLLHDIGKLALDEAMPRSFAGIVQQAKSQQACSSTIEQNNLGTDHTILGKRLAARWNLAEQIILAVWLHHTDTSKISKSMPQARIAQLVQLADLLARKCGIGRSGSFDAPDSADRIAQELAINSDQLQQISADLPGKVAQKSKALGLDSPENIETYCGIFHNAAAKLARQSIKLSQQNSQLQTASHHLDFATDFLFNITPNAEPIDIAQNFALLWQRSFQTGPVCLYLTAPAEPEVLKAVVAESPSEIKTVCLMPMPHAPAIPTSFAILDAQDHANWLLEQLDVDFDLSRTKIAPLLSGGKAVGAILFELRHPAEPEQLEKNFKTLACIAGAVLQMAFASLGQQRFAEQLAQLITTTKEAEPALPAQKPSVQQPQPPIPTPNVTEALAEMAAGAAHELNNPLSVISGRTQLLAESEPDPERKKTLTQIQQNTRQLAAIIDDLMAFAEPPQPRRAATDVKQMLDEATQLTAQKQNAEQLDIRIEVADEAQNVFIDSAQIVSAIANIFSNSIESYEDQQGPISVTASADDSGQLVKLQVTDSGCGMDAQTLQKATQPFFSAKPAGRKRGMGLAHAQRIIQLNGGSMEMASQPNQGTTVTILLPRQ
jgi:putative nucleotidyltransferase with HDIG domain